MKRVSKLLLSFAVISTILPLTSCNKYVKEGPLVIWHDKEDSVISIIEETLHEKLPNQEFEFIRKENLTENLKLVGQDARSAPDMYIFAHDKIGLFDTIGILEPIENIIDTIADSDKKSFAGQVSMFDLSSNKQTEKAKGLIDEGLKQKAESQSNIDAMMQQMQEEPQPEPEPQPQPQQVQSPQPQNVPAPAASSNVPATQGVAQSPKLLKLVTCAMLFQKMKQDKVQTILDKFDENDATQVIKYMNVDNLVDKVDAGHALKCLSEIRKTLPQKRIINTSKIVEQVQSVAEYFDKAKLEMLLKLERPNVKRFVFTALEGEYYDIPPHVAQIIATHLADSV